jgi:hypothetical protein
VLWHVSSITYPEGFGAEAELVVLSARDGGSDVSSWRSGVVEFWVWGRSASALLVSQVVVYPVGVWALGWGAG